MDLRIERTYRSLVSAFTRLLEERPYEDISVAALCDEAMIRRTTFYKHFADKGEFFSFFVDSLYRDFARMGDDVGRETPGRGGAVLKELMEFLLDHERMVNNLLESSMSAMMLSVMCGRVTQAIREQYRLDIDGTEQADMLDAASEFSSGGIARVIETWWLEGHRREDVDGLCKLVDAFVARVAGAA